MAPSAITEDLYLILEVDQNATPELITKSYRRLALKVHPDRGGSTQAFQLLSHAYEILQDACKRRAYDLIYHTINRSRANAQNTQTPRPTPASASQPEAYSEAAQLAALRKQKDERAARWSDRRKVFEGSIFELKRRNRQLEQEIKNLGSIAAAEAAVEARKNSWTTWVLSPLYKQVSESEDEKARKDRERQERRIERDLKERRLASQQAQLREKETQMARAKEAVDAADLRTDQEIQVIETRKRNREDRERREKERAERERLAKIWQEQQKQREKEAQKAREAFRKQQAEALAAELARQEERRQADAQAAERARAAERAQQAGYMHSQQRRTDDLHSRFNHGSTYETSASGCEHHGWWDKVHGRTPCPKCYDVWNYLLQCPGCATKACPKCQSDLRPRYQRHFCRTSRREVPRARSPSAFDYGYDYDD